MLFELANAANKERSKEMAGLLKALGAALGLLQRNPVEYLQYKYVEAHASLTASGSADAEVVVGEPYISAQIEARIAAKKARNFVEADHIRNSLLEAGIVLEDTPQGTIWRRA